ncbi:MAG: response regulator transcription factor [Bacteroidota bacterium]
MIRVVIADSKTLVRKGVAALIRHCETMKVAAECADGKSLFDHLEQQRDADVILLDLQLQPMDCIKAINMIRSINKKVRIIVLADCLEDRLIFDMMECGANGYLNKNSDPAELKHAIRQVVQKGHYLNESVAEALAIGIGPRPARRKMAPNVRNELNTRERQILRLICKELNNEEISQRLCLSIRTIEGYRTKIMHKTGARSLAGVVIYGIRYGLIHVPTMPGDGALPPPPPSKRNRRRLSNGSAQLK